MNSIFKTCLIFIVVIVVLAGCKKDEIVMGNRPPLPVEVVTLETGSTYAVITWEEAVDPDKDHVYYTVTLEGAIVLKNTLSVDTLTLQNLTPSMKYHGSLSLWDKTNKPVDIPFEFTTGLNQSPSPFTVTVQRVGQNFAEISWSPLKDPENDTVYQTISINGIGIDTRVAADTVFRIENLSHSTTYNGTLVATDNKSSPVEATFTFTTKKYAILFDKLLTDFNDDFMQGFAVCRTRDGGYAMASSFSFNANGYGLSVLKMDSLGEIDWHTTVEAHEEVSFEGVIEQTADDGFIITNQAAVTKLSPTGGLQWQRTPPQMFQYYNGVIETADGFLVVGMLGGSTTRGVMTKFDDAGVEQWEKFFSGTDAITVSSCNQIVKATGDGYFIAGTHQKPTVDFELATSRIDGDGNIQWVRNYPYPLQTMYVWITVRPAGSDYIIGSTSLSPNGAAYARAVRMTQTGDIVWDNSFDWGGYEVRCKSIRALDDGGFIFVGGFTNAAHMQTGYIAKLSSGGNLLWRRDFRPNGNTQDYVWQFMDLVQAADRGYLAIGFKSWIWNGTVRGQWLLKTDADGETF